jgi:hypothetical protein
VAAWLDTWPKALLTVTADEPASAELVTAIEYELAVAPAMAAPFLSHW